MTGDIQDSFELLKKCHVHNDMNIEFLKQLSRTLYLLGKPKSAVEVANEAMKFDNNDWVHC
jgi:Bardet-Biedl syndrome 4 protein